MIRALRFAERLFHAVGASPGSGVSTIAPCAGGEADVLSVACGRAIACPRDVLLIVGDEIIEAPMAQRGRYFEFRAYRSLIKDYFRAGARWTAAPKPLMSDALYDDHTPFDMNERPLLTEFEPAFDAACFARFGRDIFWQPDLVSNAFGADWLARHLGPDFRIHRMTFHEHTPVHIDATFVPVRPGLVLVNPERPCTNDMLDLFRKNDWKLVPAPPSMRSGKAPALSWAMSMNCMGPRPSNLPEHNRLSHGFKFSIRWPKTPA